MPVVMINSSFIEMYCTIIVYNKVQLILYSICYHDNQISSSYFIISAP